VRGTRPREKKKEKKFLLSDTSFSGLGCDLDVRICEGGSLAGNVKVRASLTDLENDEEVADCPEGKGGAKDHRFPGGRGNQDEMKNYCSVEGVHGRGGKATPFFTITPGGRTHGE